jgi:hypothetical protein
VEVVGLNSVSCVRVRAAFVCVYLFLVVGEVVDDLFFEPVVWSGGDGNRKHRTILPQIELPVSVGISGYIFIDAVFTGRSHLAESQRIVFESLLEVLCLPSVRNDHL